MMYTKTTITNDQKILLGEAAHPTQVGWVVYSDINRNYENSAFFTNYVYLPYSLPVPNSDNMVASGNGIGAGRIADYTDFMDKNHMSRMADYEQPERTYSSKTDNPENSRNVNVIRTGKFFGQIMQSNGDGISIKEFQ